MLLQPQCTGSITSSWLPLCLEINILIVSHQVMSICSISTLFMEHPVDISPHFFRLVSSTLPPPAASRGRTAPPPIKIHGPPIQVHGASASPPAPPGTSPASPHVRLAQCKSLSHAGCSTLCLRKSKNLFLSCCGRTPMSPFCVKHPQCQPMV